MRRELPRAPQAEGGFTLIEMLIALTLLGLVMGSLATITAEWLPSWKRGLVRAQTNEKAAIALDRLVADLSAAQFIWLNRQNKSPLFHGDEESVTFVRSALSPNGGRGLEIVRIAELTDSHGRALVRMRAPFIPMPGGDISVEQLKFADPVVLVRAPVRITFGYAGPDGKWMKTWRNTGALPTGVRFVVKDESRGSAALISTATRINVDMMAPQPEPGSDPAPDPAKAPPGNVAGMR
jgi:general secretion pathway protein J